MGLISSVITGTSVQTISGTATATAEGVTFAEAGSPPLFYFGLNSHPIWATSTGHNVEFSYLDAASCPIMRIDIGWNLIEETEGQRTGYYLDHIDDYMTKAAARGIKVLPILTTAPTWAADFAGGPPNDAHYSSYADFCAWAATRWHDACDGIEIWNEPNLSQFWAGNGDGGCVGDYDGTRTPEKYPNLLAAAYDAIKAAVPSMLVVGSGGFTSQWEDWRCAAHITNLSNYGSWAHMDALSCHNYPNHVTQIHSELTSPNQPWYNPSDPNASIIGMCETDVLSVMIGDGYGDMPIWFTETGYTTTSGAGGNSCTEAQQAIKVEELGDAFLAGEWPANFQRIYWYSMFDGKASEDSDPEKNWGLINLNNEDYGSLSSVTPKSSWTSFVNATKVRGA